MKLASDCSVSACLVFEGTPFGQTRLCRSLNASGRQDQEVSLRVEMSASKVSAKPCCILLAENACSRYSRFNISCAKLPRFALHLPRLHPGCNMQIRGGRRAMLAARVTSCDASRCRFTTSLGVVPSRWSSNEALSAKAPTSSGRPGSPLLSSRRSASSPRPLNP